MLQPNEIFDGTYRVLRKIGRGGTGVVYLAYHLRLQKYVALKKIPIGFGEIAELRRETDFMKDLHHPYLPQIYDFIYRDGEVYTVMDYIEGTDFEHLPVGPGCISEPQLIRWFRQLAEVLQYIHSRPHPIIHSDIKPGNLILTGEGSICLIDFNISVGANQRGKVLGYSANFASPEQLLLAQAALSGVASPMTLDGRSDIYSAAAVMYYLMTGQLPVTGQMNRPLAQWEGLPYSEGLLAVVDKAMSIDPDRRYSTADKLLHSLNNLVKQGPEYRRYLAVQLLSFTLCGVMAATGVYCLVRGTRERTLQAYQGDYDRFCVLVQMEETQDTIELGLDILNQAAYRSILDRQQSSRAAILHAVGDAYLRQEDIAGAEQFFQEAIRAAADTDPDLGGYYLDYGIALLKNGKTVQAELCREQASANGVATEVLQLMEGTTAAEKGDTLTARTLLMEVYSRSVSSSWRAEACEALAALADLPAEQRLSWLEEAQRLDPSAARLRRLANEALAQFNRTRSQNLAQRARECFRQLCAEPSASWTDKLNYGIVSYSTEQYPDAIYILRELEQQGMEDYRISLYLALAYYSTGSRGDAAACCAEAQRKIRELPQREQEALSKEIYDDILWLEQQLR